MEFLQNIIHSCASLVVSCMTPLATSLESFGSQLTLYLLLIGTLNHGRVISYPLGTHSWGIVHSRPLQVKIIPLECIHLETWRSRHLGKIHPLGSASPRGSLTVTPPNIETRKKFESSRRVWISILIQYIPDFHQRSNF